MTVVQDYKGWLGYRAGQLIGQEWRGALGIDSDDLAQIGAIAMWEAEKTFDETKGALPAWLTYKATGAMKDALRPRAKHNLVDHHTEIPEDVLDSSDTLQAVIEAYHSGEILDAIRQLTPRQKEYVARRFWGEWTTQDFKREWGYDPRGVWAGARPKLAEKLAHLQEKECVA